MSERHLLAVYGTLKQGFGNHRVMGDDYVFLGKGKTKDKFYMNGYGVPVVWKVPVAPVVVELYDVPEKQLLGRIDSLESNGDYYNREQIEVVLDDGTEHTAWLYFGMASSSSLEKMADQKLDVPEAGHFEWGKEANKNGW